jgi:DNA processing protein
MITAREAMEMGRDVFAVPHRAGDKGSEGPNRLIRDGARLVLSGEDIVNEFGDISRFLEGESVTGMQTRPRPGIFGGRPARSLADDSDGDADDETMQIDAPPVEEAPAIMVGDLGRTRPGATVEEANIPVFYVEKSRSKSGVEIGEPTRLDAPMRAGSGRPLPNGLTDPEKRLVVPLSDDPMPIDELISSSGIEVGEAAGLLLMLEMRGIVKQLPGKLYVRA